MRAKKLSAGLLAHWDALFAQGFFPYSRSGYGDQFALWKIALRVYRCGEDWRLVFEQLGYRYGGGKAENWVAVIGPATTSQPDWSWRSSTDTAQLTREHDFYSLSDGAALAAELRDGGDPKDPGGEWARVQDFVARIDGEPHRLRPTFEALRAAGVMITRDQYDRNPTMAYLDVLRATVSLCADAYTLPAPPSALGFATDKGPWVEVFADAGTQIIAHLDSEERPSKSDYWRQVAAALGAPADSPLTPVIARDPVERAVRRQRGLGRGELSPRRLERVRTLDLGHDPTVEDIRFVARLTKLEALLLFGTNVRDLGPLLGLTRLRELNAHWAPVASLSPLASAARLEKLEVSASHVDDLSPIAGLLGLRELGLESTAVCDLEPLRDLVRIEELSLQHTRVTDLRSLCAMTRLTRLGLDGTKVTDLAPLALAASLQILWCRDTDVFDLGPLARLARLRFVALGDSPVDDLSPLLAAPSLEEVTTRRPLEGRAARALRARGVKVTTGEVSTK